MATEGDDGAPDLRLRQMQIVAHNRHQRGDAKPSHEAKKKHPKWGRHSLSDVRTVAVEACLGTLVLAPGTRAKLRNLMHALYNHAMRWEFFDRNPITLVRQSAKRTRVPEVLTVEEIGKLLAEVVNPWRTAVYLAVTTGRRVSELLALKGADMDFATGEIRLSRGIVRQHVGQMKTEASRKPVPLDAGLADVLRDWRGQCPYNQGHRLHLRPSQFVNRVLSGGMRYAYATVAPRRRS